MNFKELYNKLSIDDVNRLNKAWGLTEDDITSESKDYFEKEFFQSWLERGIFKQAVINKEYDKFIGEEAREYLKYKVLGHDICNSKIEKDLRDKFIIVGNEIIDDFEEIIIEYIRSMTIAIEDDEPIDVIHTPFLKLILMINYVHSNKLEVHEMFRRVEARNYLIDQKTFIDYLAMRQLLTDDKKYINTTELSKWISRESESIRDFYKFITTKINVKGIFDFFNMIVKAFNNSDGWIPIKEFEKIFKKYKKEVRTGVRLGLILLKKYEKKMYMQFSPEGWFLATGEKPEFWNKKAVLMTSLNEVFIPFNFDPFVIQKFNYFDSIEKDNKTKIYSDDYFIVSKISEAKGVGGLLKFTELESYIDKYCEGDSEFA